MKRTCDVAAGLEDGSDETFNTIVVPTRDVIVTLERDPEDPLQADRVLLRSAGGAWQSKPVTMGSEGAEVEGSRIVVRFTDVPHGAHRVSVDVGDGPKNVIHDLVVRQGGVFAGGKKLGTEPPSKDLPSEIEVVDEELPREPDPTIPGDELQPTDPAVDRALLGAQEGSQPQGNDGGAR